MHKGGVVKARRRNTFASEVGSEMIMAAAAPPQWVNNHISTPTFTTTTNTSASNYYNAGAVTSKL